MPGALTPVQEDPGTRAINEVKKPLSPTVETPSKPPKRDPIQAPLPATREPKPEKKEEKPLSPREGPKPDLSTTQYVSNLMKKSESMP